MKRSPRSVDRDEDRRRRHLQAFIRAICSTAALGSENRAPLSILKYQLYLTPLADLLEFPSEVIPEIRKEVIEGAVETLLRKGSLEPASLQTEIRDRVRAHLRKPMQPWVLRTSISIPGGLLPSSMRRRGVAFRFSIPARPKFDIGDAARALKFARGVDLPSDYSGVLLRVQERTSVEAAMKALNEIELSRAIWNLGLTFRRMTLVLSGAEHRPIREISLGPLKTIHRPTGEIASSAFWYDSSYSVPRLSRLTAEHLRQLLEFERHVRTRLARIAYALDLEAVLQRYGGALDEADPAASLSLLWSAIERLTYSGADYDLLMRRTLFLSGGDSRELDEVTLGYLRDKRNAVIHAGSLAGANLMNAQMLKVFVDRLLFFHIEEGFRFKSLAEAGEFLSLPVSSEVLKERLSRLAAALEFRRIRKLTTVGNQR